jgi:predicted TIM-barrel fold metal-dependent hydrolase
MELTIIDCHCHAGKGDGFSGPWDTEAPLRVFLERSKQAGIHKTVIFPAFHSDYSFANNEVARIVAQHPGRLLGFAFVNAEADKGRVFQMVKKAVHQYGFKGLKVHRHNARISREICEAAAYFNLPVLYDVLGDVSSISLFAAQYPSVNFIIPHLGSYADDWKIQSAFIDQLVKHRNVYTDTSAVKRFDLLEEAFERAGAHKILFGTDGPWHHPGLELAKIWALEPSQQEAALMLGGNFLRLVAQVKARPTGSPLVQIKSQH